jgi:hypothetical protein
MVDVPCGRDLNLCTQPTLSKSKILGVFGTPVKWMPWSDVHGDESADMFNLCRCFAEYILHWLNIAELLKVSSVSAC